MMAFFSLLFFLEPLSNMMICPKNSGPDCLWQLILCCLHFGTHINNGSLEPKRNPSWTEIFLIIRYFYTDILLCTGLEITPLHHRQYKHFKFNGAGFLCMCLRACLHVRVCAREGEREGEVENVLGSCVNRNAKLPQECIFTGKLRVSYACLLQFQAKCKRH